MPVPERDGATGELPGLAGCSDDGAPVRGAEVAQHFAVVRLVLQPMQVPEILEGHRPRKAAPDDAG